MEKDCIFCKIINGELPSTKIYEDDKVLAFLDINPVNPGHTLVIPKEHFETFHNASEEAIIDVTRVINKLTPAITKGIDAEGFNIHVNNGAVAGQIIFHLHFHIVPRFPADGLHLWEGKKYEAGQIEEVADKIKSNL